jgi:hypothetical protein
MARDPAKKFFDLMGFQYKPLEKKLLALISPEVTKEIPKNELCKKDLCT